MKRTILAVTMGLAVAAAGPIQGHAASDATGGNKSAPSGQERQLDPKLPGVGDHEQEFAYQAHSLLAPLTEMSKLGADKGQDADLVDLSKQMARQYADLTKDLEQAAQAAGIDASEGEAPHGENRLHRLQMSGDEFDLAYVIEQHGLHEKLIAIYTMQTRAKKDDALTEHAKKGKDILGENLDKINQIEARLRKARTSPGR